ncbi:MAG: hypothetical protein F6J93_02515 [Oscillatoria sp. SIO1A7]|nr:hypothetical protein [Oscillatoria sp. SIO1A7]
MRFYPKLQRLNYFIDVDVASTVHSATNLYYTLHPNSFPYTLHPTP